MTNKKFAEKSEEFRAACKLAGLNPTSRQASKYRNQKGLAYKAAKNIGR